MSDTNDKASPAERAMALRAVDRETAHKLNPFISNDPLSEDTRSSVAEALRFLSDVIVTWEAEGAEKPTPERIGRLTDQLDMLAAALDYEAAQVAKPAAATGNVGDDDASGAA